MIIVTLSVVCTLMGTCQYNTNNQSVYVAKGSKETLTALTVLIVTHVTQVEMTLFIQPDCVQIDGDVGRTAYTCELRHKWYHRHAHTHHGFILFRK